MAGGINISKTAGTFLAQTIGVDIVRNFLSAAAAPAVNSGPWRPPQWSQPAQTSIMVPAAYSAGVEPTKLTEGPDGSPPIQTLTVSKTQATLYVFDGVMRIGHRQGGVKTQHPIQTGANIADHFYLLNADLILEVGMSDAMDAYAQGMWTGNPSKSVSAYRTMLNLQAAAIPLTITTRLKTYTNMMIMFVESEDSVRTRNGLRASIALQELRTAVVASSSVSARPQATSSTALGTLQATPPAQGVTQQHKLPSTLTGIESPVALEHQFGIVPGAGNWSSNNTTTLLSELRSA